MAQPGYDPYDEAQLRAAAEQSMQTNRFYTYGQFAPRAEEKYGFQVKGFDPEEYDEEDEYLSYLQDNTNRGPAELTERPTSSTNSARPRTVAAGYQPYYNPESEALAYSEQLGKMTVMFRDGTLYNYYDVTRGEWQNFRASISKGRPWLNKGFVNSKNPNPQRTDGLFISKPQGPADMSNVPKKVLRSIYSIARSSQVQFASSRNISVRMYTPEGDMFRQTFGPKKGPRGKRTGGVVTKKAIKQAGISRNSPNFKAAGINPNKNAGRNPNQK